MTMIAGIGFTDEVIILSDSRVSFLDKNLKPKDTLKKIYKLSKYSCFAYTSGDVEFTHHIIESITKYATNIQVRKTDVFLKMITERASQEYITLSRKFNKLPDMLFIYAGLVDGSYKIPRNKFVAIKKKYDENIWMPKKLKYQNQQYGENCINSWTHTTSYQTKVPRWSSSFNKRMGLLCRGERARYRKRFR